ncbi:unnamed protein product [Rotaria sordida]|uniref:Uncharacterized protein n=1 Tax=Rotaria sordida TaxID=392033 RepID=A0A819MLL5_9BILA|nr:unnamed protein product [Rotaria sordida]CAF3981509.1 unnamed protein product [Rotaria sordida]
MFVLNNEYLEELHGQLPLTSMSELRGDILRNNFSSKIADVCQSGELDYIIDHVQLLTDVNQRNLLSSNDDINKHICDSDTSITQRTLGTSFPSNDNELHFTENMNIVTQATVQDMVDIVVNESVSVNTIPVITPCTSTCKNNSDDLITNVRCQTAQATASMKLSTSLQFGHDVHPYQKTQHDKDVFDKLLLRLINISSSSTINKSDNEIFHQLDEDIVKNLHPTPYDSNFIRLMCILVLNHKIVWDTLCLSDYIRPIQELQI